MSSMLHPVGPEEPQTYWVRRAVVIAAAVLALIVVIAIIVSQNSSGSVVAQPTPSVVAPSPTISGPPPYTPTPTPTPSSSSSASAPTKAKESSKESAKAKESPKAKESASPSPKSTGPAACAPKDLRPTLTGDQRLTRKEKNTFAISLINGSGSTCVLKVDQDNFELKIYSGKDRIWSTKDCSKAVTSVSKKLAKEQAVEWKMTWDGRRSKDDCKQRPEVPKAGTYFATAQFDGAKPVQLRMIIRG